MPGIFIFFISLNSLHDCLMMMIGCWFDNFTVACRTRSWSLSGRRRSKRRSCSPPSWFPRLTRKRTRCTVLRLRLQRHPSHTSRIIANHGASLMLVRLLTIMRAPISSNWSGSLHCPLSACKSLSLNSVLSAARQDTNPPSMRLQHLKTLNILPQLSIVQIYLQQPHQYLCPSLPQILTTCSPAHWHLSCLFYSRVKRSTNAIPTPVGVMCKTVVDFGKCLPL